VALRLRDVGCMIQHALQTARKDAEIAVLTRQRDILIASHKALILAVGELGGMRAWRRFFDQNQDVVDEMRKLGAMPTADTLDLSQGDSDRRASR
jgi:hypothetical protein